MWHEQVAGVAHLKDFVDLLDPAATSILWTLTSQVSTDWKLGAASTSLAHARSGERMAQALTQADYRCCWAMPGLVCSVHEVKGEEGREELQGEGAVLLLPRPVDREEELAQRAQQLGLRLALLYIRLVEISTHSLPHLSFFIFMRQLS